MSRAQHLENRSLLLNVDSATLPPSGTETQCRQGAFHYHNLRAVDFLPQNSRDIDRLHIHSFKIYRFKFYRQFYDMQKICPAFAFDFSLVARIVGWCRFFFFFFLTSWMFLLVSHFQTALVDDSYVQFTWHYLSESAFKPTLFLFNMSK